MWFLFSKCKPHLTRSNYFNFVVQLEYTLVICKFIHTGVRGTKGFTEGEHYWEVVFLEPPCGTSVMIGVGTENVALHRSNFEYIDLIGKFNKNIELVCAMCICVFFIINIIGAMVNIMLLK